MREDTYLIFNISWAPMSLLMVTAAAKIRYLLLGRKAMTNLESILKNRDLLSLFDKSVYSQNYGFSSSHVWMWKLDHNEGWALKNLCFWSVEKTLESPLDSKKFKPVNPTLNIHWKDWLLKLKFQYFWLPDAKSWLIGKDPDAGKDWGQMEKEVAEGKVASLTLWTWIWANSGR